MESLNDLNLNELKHAVEKKISDVADKLEEILGKSPYDWAMEADKNARSEIMNGTFNADEADIDKDFETYVEIQTMKEKSKLISSDEAEKVQELEIEVSAYENILNMILAMEEINNNPEYDKNNIGALKTCSAKLAVFIYIPEDLKVLPDYNKSADIFKTCTTDFVPEILEALEKLKTNKNDITDHINETIGYLDGNISVYSIIKDNINEVKKIKDKYEELDLIDDEKASLFGKLENLDSKPVPNMLDKNMGHEK